MRYQTPYNSLRVLSRQVAVGNRRPLSSPAVNGRDTVLVGLLHAWIVCPSMFPTRASYMCVCACVYACSTRDLCQASHFVEASCRLTREGRKEWHYFLSVCRCLIPLPTL